MKKIEITSTRVLKELEKQSLFCWEGMSASESNLKAIENAAADYTGNKSELTFIIWKGALMNITYNLTGDNAYNDNLTFVGIKDFYNTKFKIDTGARWLDDIVDNNRRRELEKYEH